MRATYVSAKLLLELCLVSPLSLWIRVAHGGNHSSDLVLGVVRSASRPRHYDFTLVRHGILCCSAPSNRIVIVLDFELAFELPRGHAVICHVIFVSTVPVERQLDSVNCVFLQETRPQITILVHQKIVIV